MLDGAVLHAKLVLSDNCLEQRSLLIYQNLMFNFRFLSLGNNNQLHLLPIKVLMAHQSKKNHWEWRSHKLYTHIIFLKLSFISKISEIYKLYPWLCTLYFSCTTILIAEFLRLWGQMHFPWEETVVLYLKSNNDIHAKSGRILLTSLQILTKVNYQVYKKQSLTSPAVDG